jgi:hypothetical protein
LVSGSIIIRPYGGSPRGAAALPAIRRPIPVARTKVHVGAAGGNARPIIRRQGETRRRCRTAATAFVALLTIGACVGSARGETDYQKKAVATTEHVRSSVRTVQLVIHAAAEDDAFGPFLSRVISQAEDDASSALNGFDTIQPPDDTADQLRDDVDQIASDSIDLLAEARIAIRRGDLDGLIELAEPLAEAGDNLERFGQDHHV